MKVAFLDRDGTINKEYPDEVWPTVEFPEILEKVPETLRELKKRDYKIIIVSNQPLINKGVLTWQQYETFTSRLLSELKKEDVVIDDIHVCPHFKEEGCRCRKPGPEMIERALEKYPNIDLSKSFVAGDRITDVRLAQAFNMRSFSIGFDADGKDVTRIESLAEVLNYI